MNTPEIAVEAAGLRDPTIIGEAAQKVAKEWPTDFRIYLFGNKNILEKYCSKGRIEVHDYPHFPSDSEKLLLKDKNLGSSLEKTLEFAKNKNIPALCLASTGITRYIINRERYLLKGVEKPAIAVEVPRPEGFNIIIDAGLNANLRMMGENVNEKDLIHFALMGACYLNAKGYDPIIGFSSFNEKIAHVESFMAKRILEKIGCKFKLSDSFFRGIEIHKEHSRVIAGEADKINDLLTDIEGYAQTLLEEGFLVPGTKYDQNNYGSMPALGTFPNIMIGHRHTGPEKAVSAIRRSLEFFEIKDKLNDMIVETLGNINPLLEKIKLHS